MAERPPITTSTVTSGTGSTIEQTAAFAISFGRSPLEEAFCKTVSTPNSEVKVYLLGIGQSLEYAKERRVQGPTCLGLALASFVIEGSEQSTRYL